MTAYVLYCRNIDSFWLGGDANRCDSKGYWIEDIDEASECVNAESAVSYIPEGYKRAKRILRSKNKHPKTVDFEVLAVTDSPPKVLL